MESATVHAADEPQHVVLSREAFDTTEFTSPESQTSQTTDWGVGSEEHPSPGSNNAALSPPTHDTPAELGRAVCATSPTIVPKDFPKESVLSCSLADNSYSRGLPVLSRIHILPLGPDATDALKDVIEQRDRQGLFFPDFLRTEGRFAEAQARLNSDAAGSSTSGSSLEEPYPIMRHLSELLALCPGQNGFPLSLFQAFHVSCNSKVYVVVDMEGISPQDPGTATGSSTEENPSRSRARRVRLGFLSQSTAIFTAGYPIELLESVHLSLVRPFKLRTTEAPSHPRAPTVHHDSSVNGSPRPPDGDGSIVPPVRRLRSLFTRRRVGTTLTTHIGASQNNPVHLSSDEDPSSATGRVHETQDDSALASGGLTGARGSQALSPSCLPITAETQPREEARAPLPTASSSLPGAATDVPNPPSLSMECNSQNSLGNLGSSFFDGPFFHTSIPPPACPGAPPDTHNTPFDSHSVDAQSGPVVVDLLTLVQKELFKNPFIVFVRGREWTFHAAVDLASEPLVRSSAPSHEPEREKSTPSELFGIKNPFARVFGRHAKNGATGRHPAQPLDHGEGSKSRVAPLGPLVTRFRFFVPYCNGLALGVAVPGKTSICVEPDPVGEFSRIHISPIADTVPVSYEFDFFNGYLRPFLEKFPAYLFAQGDLFTFHGVQFKVMRTEPAFVTEIEIPDKHCIFWKPFNGVLPQPDEATLQRSVATRVQSASARLVLDEEWAKEDRRFKSRCLTRRNQGVLCSRIGRSTRVHRGSPISIHWIDLVPQPVIDNIRTMPTRLQPFALLYAITDLGPQNISRLLDWPADDLPLNSLPGSISGEGSPSVQHQQMRERLSLKIVEEYATTYRGTDARRHRKVKQLNNTDQEPGSAPPEDEAQQRPSEPGVCLVEQIGPAVSPDSGPQVAEDTETTTCVVCLDAIRLNERILELPCSHLFHVKCVVEWLKRSILCPVCKQDLREFL